MTVPVTAKTHTPEALVGYLTEHRSVYVAPFVQLGVRDGWHDMTHAQRLGLCASGVLGRLCGLARASDIKASVGALGPATGPAQPDDGRAWTTGGRMFVASSWGTNDTALANAVPVVECALEDEARVEHCVLAYVRLAPGLPTATIVEGIGGSRNPVIKALRAMQVAGLVYNANAGHKHGADAWMVGGAPAGESAGEVVRLAQRLGVMLAQYGLDLATYTKQNPQARRAFGGVVKAIAVLREDLVTGVGAFTAKQKRGKA